ncbi:MAG: 2-hydroxyacid dehydrogenase [Ferruginibacter sp.]
MRTLFYSSKAFERSYLLKENTDGQIIEMITETLNDKTAHLAKGFEAISIFTGDDASAGILEKLEACGVKYIAIRAAGYDNTDITKANELRICVANVPKYSPHAIAEHAVALILALNRKLIIGHLQLQAHNFTLDNLIGYNLNNKKVGIIGTGETGSVAAKILHGFGCNISAYDIMPDKENENKFGVTYTSLEELCKTADIITIHTPLNEQTKYLINDKLIKLMKRGVMIINTARGAVVNTADIIENLLTGQVGFYGMDVYEKEKGIFFYDYSDKELNDGQLIKLMAMPSVLVTPHQAFATAEALQNIAATTMYNLNCWAKNMPSENELPHR